MTRYAIYGVPGLDDTAPEVAVRLRERVERWYADEPEITADPRRYGFHATLKAPFRLASGRDADELERAAAAFAASEAPVALRGVRPAAIGSFRALVPTRDTAEIDALAARVVDGFEAFRAPLTDAEIARRRPERLTPRQRELLAAYGYPYVHDEFRVHMTLTDALADDGAAVDARLEDAFADLAGADIPLTAIAIFAEDAPGEPFRIHSIHPLAKEA